MISSTLLPQPAQRAIPCEAGERSQIVLLQSETIIIVFFYGRIPNRGWIKPDFNTVHTCRDYNALRKWSLHRDSATPETYPDNAKRLRSQWNLGEWMT